MESRRDSAVKLVCMSCGWVGTEAQLDHTYVGCHPNDVEPISYCPRCGNDNFELEVANG